MENKKRIYFIGITGVGMSALAQFCQGLGHEVTGSDVEEEFITDELLKEEGIERFFGFKAENLEWKPDLIVIGAAFGESNPEMVEAKKLGIPMKYYSEAIAEMTSHLKTIAVAGVHGKTTTTAMLALVFHLTKQDPNYLIGSAHVPGLPSNAAVGSSPWFIIEADEYKKSPEDNTPKFLDFKPTIATINAIEWDHPDVFANVEEVYQSFYKFACSVVRGGTIVANIDSQPVRKLINSLADRRFITFGFDSDAAWKIVNWRYEDGKSIFQISHNGIVTEPIILTVPGRHNVYNAVTALAVATTAGVEFSKASKALAEFKGVERRFEIIFDKNNTTIIDDYAHHPTAIELTLETVASFYPDRRIICIFQPHTYSRTKAMLQDFAKSFTKASKVIIPDIFGSAREKSQGIHSRHLVFEISRHHPDVTYRATLSEVTDYVLEIMQPDDVIITIGAGDVYKVGRTIAEKLV